MQNDQHGLKPRAIYVRALSWFLLAGLLVLPVVITPVLPLIDYYNHLGRFHVLAHVDDPFFARYYAPNWHLLPNIGLDVIAVPLARLLSPMVLSKALIAGILFAQLGATLLLNRALTGRVNKWSALIAAALCYSFILNWGFANYLVGQALALFAMACWIGLRHRPIVATIVCAAIAPLILVAHGFAFGLYGFALCAFEYGFWLNQPQRRAAVLAKRWSLIALQAVAPVILFISAGMLRAPAHASEGTTHTNGGPAAAYSRFELLQRLPHELMVRLSALFRVAETPWMALDAALFIATIALIVWAIRRAAIHVVTPALPVLATLVLLTLIMPPSFLGAAHFAERIPLFLGLILAAAITETRAGTVAMFAAFPLLFAVTATRLAAVSAGWYEYRQHYANFEQLRAQLRPNAIVAPLIVAGMGVRDAPGARCQMYSPLTVIEAHDAVSLFADPTQQPLLLRGDLRALVETNRPSPEMMAQLHLGKQPFFYDDAIARIAAQRIANYALICNADRLRRPLPPNLKPVGPQGGQLSLFEID